VPKDGGADKEVRLGQQRCQKLHRLFSDNMGRVTAGAV
jgi:hypothetical protein